MSGVSGADATESGTQSVTITITENESAPTVTLSVSATKIGPDMAKTVNGEIPATLWKISGDLDLDLLYAKDGKWLGSRFYAGGSQAEFLLQKSEGNMHSLWKV